jgi:two-component system alkaline phosphatase synthesis response regulator PhoP
MAKKILVVEDEKILGEMYRDILIHAGFKAEWARSAEEGLEILPKIKPDLILLDILLPRASGIGFLKQIRELKDFASTRVLAFSNYDEPTTKREALELGAKDYLIKTNYTPQEVVDKIKEHLKKK